MHVCAYERQRSGTEIGRLEGVGFAVRVAVWTKRLTRSKISGPAIEKTKYG